MDSDFFVKNKDRLEIKETKTLWIVETTVETTSTAKTTYKFKFPKKSFKTLDEVKDYMFKEKK